jgi:hypothetical protein
MSFRRVKALFDRSAWILILPALVAMYWIDRPMLATLIEWVIFAPILAGVAIFISRIIFPQIHLTEAVEQAINERSLPAALIASSIVFFVGILFFALVVWARA